METSVYLRRSGIYIARVLIIITILFVAMVASGTSRVGGEQLLDELFFSWRGAILFGALLLLALWYPKLGYGVMRIKADMLKDKDVIVNAFISCAYELHSDEGGIMVFRSKSALRRGLAFGEDGVTMSSEADGIVLEGRRKDLSKVELRIRVFLKAN